MEQILLSSQEETWYLDFGLLATWNVPIFSISCKDGYKISSVITWAVHPRSLCHQPSHRYKWGHFRFSIHFAPYGFDSMGMGPVCNMGGIVCICLPQGGVGERFQGKWGILSSQGRSGSALFVDFCQRILSFK